MLLERDWALAVLRDVLERMLQGEGWLVAVTGEVGIGKSALVRAFVADRRDRARFFLAGCDDLLTPRPLGPLHDLLRAIGPPVDRLAEPGIPTTRLFPDLAAELAGRLRPAVLVVEDLQWADSATLDWLAYLARRLEDVAVMLVVTYRDDEREAVAELGRVLAAAPRHRLERIPLEPLSAAAAQDLLGSDERVDEVMALTNGNPLFLHEVAESGGQELPSTIRDIVATRLSGLDAATRDVVDVVAAVPGRCEWDLLETVIPEWPTGSDGAMATGLMEEDEHGLAFRHEVVRHAAEAEMSGARRRILHGRVLEALERLGGAPARLAHHARRAGRGDDVLRLATLAAEEAVAAGAHRQAVEQYRAALDHANALPSEAHADLLGAFATEAQICNRLEDAITARLEACARWTDLGRVDRAGAELASLARLHWWAGNRTDAEEAARDAIDRLEPLGPSAALSTAYGCLADILMAVGEPDEAVQWGERALRLAEDLGDPAALAATLSDAGSGAMFVDTARGESLLARAFALADDGGHAAIAGRAVSTLAMGCLYHRRYDVAAERLDEAYRYAHSHELPAQEAAVLGLRSRWHLDQGEWELAERDAQDMLGAGDQPGVSLCPALVTLGLLHARRGEPDAADVLDDAWERALHTGDLQRIAPTAAARAELAWLADDLEGVEAAARPGFDLACEVGEPWATGELAWWLQVAGRDPEVTRVAEPFAFLLRGEWSAAAAAWEARGLPYERALALASAPDPEPVFAALEIVDGLGAGATGMTIRRRLRELGVERVPRGPRPATRSNPAGLTDRQVDVLERLARGLTNQQIADELVLSVRTVDHHVSAVLQKLAVPSRDAAAAWYLDVISG